MQNVPVISKDIWRLIEANCIPGGSASNLRAANDFVDWGDATQADKSLLTDAQTSGGLLLCVPPRKLSKVLDLLKRERTMAAAVIGRTVKGSARIEIT
jgi:selenide,water dikinase